MSRAKAFRIWDGARILTPDTVPLEANETYYLLRAFVRALTNKNFILMQYTGLKDKNGKDIYESDIVKLYHKYAETNKAEYVFCEIIWSDDNAMFCLKWPDGYINLHPLTPYKYEVVGNIYENSQQTK